MERTAFEWKTVALWGFVLFAVFTFGAFVGEPFTGTCMFVLMPYFAAIAACMPIVKVRRFGAGILTFIPYAVLGFVPLLYFDWLQSRALWGLWAVFVWSATGPIIGLTADLAYLATGRLSQSTRAIVVGATIQAMTFALMLLGLTFLYSDPSAGDSHLRLFDRYWFFTAPWMAVNGAFGGFTAHALANRAARDTSASIR